MKHWFFRAMSVWVALLPLMSAAQVERTIAGFSVRARVDGTATGASMLAVNFTVEGATKAVLLRAVGPTLGTFGVPGVLSDPVLRVHDGTGALIEANSGWSTALAPAFATAGTFALPAGSKDAALQLSLAPGTYTATVGSVTGSLGVVLLEVFDLQVSGRLAYVAARGQAGTANDQLAAGFVVPGTTPAPLLVRGLGPALAAAGMAGTLANPLLSVSHGASVVTSNDDWNGASGLSEAAVTAGLMPLAAASRDAATLVTTTQGNFVAQISGTGGATGLAMVEVAQVDANRAASFAPAILAPPRDVALASGSSATLTALAVGKPAPSYQWRKNGQAIAGATTASFTIGAAQASDAGTYTVALTNLAGTTVATVGTVTVSGGGMTITQQPVSQSVPVGGTATFAVTAAGPGGLSYQWLFNGNPIASATQGTLTLTNVTTAQAGQYAVRVSSGASVVTSTPATLEVRPRTLAILTPPAGQVVESGGTAMFSVVATGMAPVTYQWLRDGVAIAGATQSSYTIVQASVNSAATYAVRVMDMNGSVTSGGATLTVRPRPVAGGYFGVLGSGGQFGLLVRADGTGVFLAYANGTRQGLVATDVRVDAARRFEFTATALGGTGPALYTVSGRITEDGLLLPASIAGLTATLSVGSSGGPVTTGSMGFYKGGAPGGAGRSYALVGAAGEVMAVTVESAVADGGRGTLGANGSVLVVTESGARTEGSVQEGILALVTTPVGGGERRGALLANADMRTDAEKLVNISTRSQTGSGNAALIAGFVVAGERAKPMLVRAIGPTLAGFGVGGPLAAVRLEVFRGQTPVAIGLDWGAGANASEVASAAGRVGAFALPPASRDAALLLTLEPGAYTAVVSGQTEAATGVSLVEVYDASVDARKDERIVNIATRGVVGSGDQTLIAGFVITGRVPKRVLVRGVGPTLASSFGVTGVLAQPRLTVLAGSPAAEVATNVRWSTRLDAAEIAAAAQAAGAFPLAAGSEDAALVVNLMPGTYSAQVTNAAGGGGGVALVEVYELR